MPDTILSKKLLRDFADALNENKEIELYNMRLSKEHPNYEQIITYAMDIVEPVNGDPILIFGSIKELKGMNFLSIRNPVTELWIKGNIEINGGPYFDELIFDYDEDDDNQIYPFSIAKVEASI